jgi:hypothetical protein
MKGDQQPVEHFEPNFEGRYARKKLAGLLNRLPRLQPSFSTTGSTFEYLIGQQRLQSMPHPATKSSVNLKILLRQTLYSLPFADRF